LMGDATELRTGEVAQRIRENRLIVILRRVEPQSQLLEIVDELADAGARVFEVTFDAPSAADDLRAIRSLLTGRSDGPFTLGAGTLLTRDQFDAARDAGADFGVSPMLDLDLLPRALDASWPFIPGGLTPTELRAGWEHGATFMKLFPASAVGPQLIRELRGPLPEIEVIPTGGVDGSNATAFLEAGAVAVGLGSAIVRTTPIERRGIIQSISGAKP
ncbi:MAG TPA: bifunctional 4-hydroxy-2-oxoglutarate aldolase/2-dehydro-3-deoxy-phosphogluconate aldolase, partial [Candidatus Limnocylindrales bacterium]|nr:bifunctional 4-hydroxy-2-oxoglutarate aldolase/2-dehydro-3-deoxy-phosphogluconate aldolase [Candidatus Limnocylindrales bacterium]